MMGPVSGLKITMLYRSGGRRVDGVLDYTLRLTEALRSGLGVDVRVCDRGPGFRWTVHQDGADAREVSGRDVAADFDRADWVVIQYSPFAFGRWGVAPWLVRLARRIAGSGSARLAIMVHEPFVVEGLLSRIQQYQLRALLSVSSIAFASIERWSESLVSLNAGRCVIHLPVASNLPDRRANREAARERLGARPETTIVAAFGSARPGRQVGFIRVAADAVASRASSPILLLNLGADAPDIESRVRNLSQLKPGYQTPDELGNCLAAADLFLAPFTDGVSTRRTTLASAMQHGVPVVGTYGALTDSVLTGPESGLILVPADRPDAFALAAQRLAADGEERAVRGDLVRAAYERLLGWPVVTRRFLASLDQPER